MKKVFLVLLLLSVACTEVNKKAAISAIVGGLIGGGIGAIAGHQADNEGAGIAIGVAAGAGVGALIGKSLDNQTDSTNSNNIVSSQDRMFYPNQDFADNNGYLPSNFLPNSTDNVGYKSYSYNANNASTSKDSVSSGYFGAINGGTYSDYDNNLMNYVNTGEARGYIGSLNDPRVKNVSLARNDAKGLYGAANYTGGSYAGKSYLGVNENNVNDVPSVVNVRNEEYPMASYNWDNSNKAISNNSSDIYNTVQANQVDDDCVKAKDEVREANKTEVLADKLFYFRKALRLCPDIAEYHNGLGEVYLILNRKDDAAYEFKEALKINPSLSTARKNLNMVNNKY